MSAAEQWQRLSPWALVLIIVNGLITTIRQNIGFLLGAGAGFVFLDWLGPRELGLGALALVLIAIVAAMVYHRRFRFRLEGDAIRIRRGLIERKELRIRFARVLNVNLSQPFYLRPLGLVRFSLETAGAAHKEVELPGISRALAEDLRARIAAARADAETLTERPPVPDAIGLYRAGDTDLLLHGLASNQIWIITGAFLGLLGVFQQRLSDLAMLQALGERLLDWFGDPLLAVVVVGVGVVAGIAVLSMLISWVRFKGFRLEYADDRYRSRAGLLDRKEQTLPVAKLHAFELVQTAIGRLLGRWYLEGRQAGTLATGERQGQLMVPGLGRDTAEPLLVRLAGASRESSAFSTIEPLFKRVMCLRVGLIFIPIGVALLVMTLIGHAHIGQVHDWVIFGAALLLVLALVQRRWQRWGYLWRDGRLWLREGLFGQRITTFALDRVQQVQVRQSPAQYRKQVANLVLVLPHGPVTVPFLPLAVARPLANEALYRVETAAEHRI